MKTTQQTSWTAVALATLSMATMPGCKDFDMGIRAQNAHQWIDKEIHTLAAESETIGRYLNGDSSINRGQFDRAVETMSGKAADMVAYLRRVSEGAEEARRASLEK